MAFEQATIPATVRSSLVQIHAVYATQFSLGDPYWDVQVEVEQGEVVATLSFSEKYESAIIQLLSSREMESFSVKSLSEMNAVLSVRELSPISPYGEYISSLFLKTATMTTSRFTASTGDRFIANADDGIIRFKPYDLEIASDGESVWVSRREFFESLAMI